jgi:hypothetical protein
MATGTHTPNSPAKDNHMANFDEAMKDALKQHGGSGDKQVTVTFGVVVTPNPGGVKEYVVTISPGG